MRSLAWMATLVAGVIPLAASVAVVWSLALLAAWLLALLFGIALQLRYLRRKRLK